METNAQVEYKVATSVEYIVPNGFGRCRNISEIEEKKLLNFYNIARIRFSKYCYQ